ncbi:hypothetical protein BH09VER1_BH09VER1_55540 [soil metagenome]
MPLRQFLPLALVALALPFGTARALMTFGGTTTTNTTDPGNGVPWVNVVEIENGSGDTVGSGVYLGNQFVLTANHVGPVSQIDIGGSTFLIDTSFNASYSGGSFSGGFSQIGNTDLKLVRLTQNPVSQGVAGLQTINLNSSTTQDVNSLTTNYIIGYGESKGTAITGTGTGGWNWAAGTEGTERWGTNNIAGTYTATNGSWITKTLVTTFDSTSGSDEAAVELDDSGGALFYKFGSSWFLSGITLYVSTNGASYYANAGGGGPTQNFFGRISDYQSQINTALAVPEPCSIGLLAVGAGALLIAKRRELRKT